MKKSNYIYLVVLFFVFNLLACNNPKTVTESTTTSKKVGVLLVNHGSRSETWRNGLLAMEKEVDDSILQMPSVLGIKTAFMEYNEPSIATQLKAFDSEGFTDIIIVPVFLTVSSHSFDDIPTIIGQKVNPHSAEMLKIEKIETYSPKAKVHITPLLDFSSLLEKNILRRFNALSNDASQEGMVLIAYGDVTYNAEWSSLMEKVGAYVNAQTGLPSYSYGWCGHIVHYEPDSTTVAINKVLKTQKRAVVIPVLVAHDEMFQVQIIGDGIKKIKDHENRVVYKPDAILPDENLNAWVIDAVSKELVEINK